VTAYHTHRAQYIFLRLEYFFTRSRRNGARKRAIELAESRSRCLCLAGECEHARECESRRSSAEQSSLAHYDRGAAPMPAFSPASCFLAGVRAYTFVRVFSHEYSMLFCFVFSNYVEDYYLKRYSIFVFIQYVRVVLYVIRKNPAKKRTFVTKNTYTRVRASTRARNQFL
jgi:hypothetical protein